MYEQILQVPYYIIFSRDPDKFKAFQLIGKRYHSIKLNNDRLWFDELKLGIGLWQGVYRGFERKWLRWYDQDGKWIPTSQEEKQQAKQKQQQAEQKQQQAEQKQQQAEQKQQQAEKLAAQLIAQIKALGLKPDV